jgi:hypothetical protein
LILSVPGLAEFVEFFKKRKFIIYGICAIYLLCLSPYLLIFVFTVREKDKAFRIDQVNKVVDVVKENSTEKEIILTDWPGYAVLAKRGVVQGTETCGYEISHLLTKDQLKRFNIIDKKEIENIIKNKEVNLIVTGIGTYRNLNDLIQENYYPLEKIGESKVFLKK